MPLIYKVFQKQYYIHICIQIYIYIILKWNTGICNNLMRETVFVAQLLSHVWLFATPWTAPCQASRSFTISQNLLKLMSIESVMPSNHLILCHPLLLSSIFLSIRVFSNESTVCIRWPKYWSFSFSTSISNEHSGLISFRIDQFDFLVVQGTLPGIFSSTTVQKHQFLGIRPSLWSSSHIYTWLLEKQ